MNITWPIDQLAWCEQKGTRFWTCFFPSKLLAVSRIPEQSADLCAAGGSFSLDKGFPLDLFGDGDRNPAERAGPDAAAWDTLTQILKGWEFTSEYAATRLPAQRYVSLKVGFLDQSPIIRYHYRRIHWDWFGGFVWVLKQS